jgi:superfamily II DNA helicase RecQ
VTACGQSVSQVFDGAKRIFIMAFAFFRVSSSDSESANELNRFLAGNSVIRVERHFHAEQSEGYWSFCVEYRPRQKPVSARKGERERIDYKETLTPAEFEVYDKLRDVRKEISERDGLPLYAVATNEQLAEISKRRVTAKAGLREIVDFGAARIRKYGIEFLRVMATNEELDLLQMEQTVTVPETSDRNTAGEGPENAAEDKGRAQRNRELFKPE